MKPQGISLLRISSSGQLEGHSLDAQQSSTAAMANEMGVEISKEWSIVQSAKAGRNMHRKELKEMLAYAKTNREVKYLFIDRVSRLMREMMALINYIYELNNIGVEVIVCDVSQRHLNSGDQLSKLMLILEGFKAEQENRERAEITNSRMIARYSAGYYLSHPHQGYMTSDTPGVHIPDTNRFNLLQKAGYLIIYEQYTVSQAIKWLGDQGYITPKGGRKLDINHYVEFITDRYYCGIINIKKEGPLSSVKNVQGLHKPMFSVREHDLLVAAITKRNPRMRQKHNPDFPLSNLIRHHECMNNGRYEKFTGHHFNRGKRPNGIQRKLQPVYDCRDCRKRISREKAHQALAEHLLNLEFLPDPEAFRKALIKVWKQQRGSVTQRLNILTQKKSELERKLMEATESYAQEKDEVIRQSMGLLLNKYSQQIKELEIESSNVKQVEIESEDFVNFAFKFIEDIRINWWRLSWENQKRGEQILFNGKIYIDNSANVHTPCLSSIYRLGTNKKALSEVDNAHLVELVGSAPTSIGLLW